MENTHGQRIEAIKLPIGCFQYISLSFTVICGEIYTLVGYLFTYSFIFEPVAVLYWKPAKIRNYHEEAENQQESEFPVQTCIYPLLPLTNKCLTVHQKHAQILDTNYAMVDIQCSVRTAF